jgi:integrase
MLALTGQRLNEVEHMRWAELDLAAKIWTLLRERGKHGHAHVAPLSDQAIAILEAQPREGALVFSVSRFEAKRN